MWPRSKSQVAETRLELKMVLRLMLKDDAAGGKLFSKIFELII